MVSWYRAESDATDFQDGNDGTLNGATFAAGKVGQAFSFDGGDDRVSTNLDVQPSAMPSTTWDAWVFPTRVNHGSRQTIFTNDDAGFDRGVIIEANTSNFGVFTGAGVWQPVPVTLNQWQHIAVVYTPTNIKFYKNGVEFSFGAAPVGQASNNTFHIGMNPLNGGIEFFQGRIDEVEVFNSALAAADIITIVDAGNAGKCYCGNGSVDLSISDQCEDGNLVGDDCCSATCQYETSGSFCGSSSDTDCTNPDTCNGSGVCQVNHAPDNMLCTTDADTNECTTDVCTAGECTHPNKEAGATCGGSENTDCDNPDSCNGTGICQTNPEPSSTSCGDTGSACVNQDTCDGAGECADNGFVSSGEPCGDPTATDCNNFDTCNGSGMCQTNTAPDNTPCTTDSNECTTDVCLTGECTHPNKDAGAPCGDSSDTACDNPDSCNGSGTCLFNLEPSTTVCRPAAGVCDVAETCTGSAAACPADAVKPATTGCMVNGQFNKLCQGTAGLDIILGTGNADVIRGGGGNDILNGLGGNDVVCGEGGNDTLRGGGGTDGIEGGPGNDNLDGGVGVDTLDGGPGTDFLNGGLQGATCINGETNILCTFLQ